jgi:hypothetical protein
MQFEISESASHQVTEKLTLIDASVAKIYDQRRHWDEFCDMFAIDGTVSPKANRKADPSASYPGRLESAQARVRELPTLWAPTIALGSLDVPPDEFHFIDGRHNFVALWQINKAGCIKVAVPVTQAGVLSENLRCTDAMPPDSASRC